MADSVDNSMQNFHLQDNHQEQPLQQQQQQQPPQQPFKGNLTFNLCGLSWFIRTKCPKFVIYLLNIGYYDVSEMNFNCVTSCRSKSGGVNSNIAYICAIFPLC